MSEDTRGKRRIRIEKGEDEKLPEGAGGVEDEELSGGTEVAGEEPEAAEEAMGADAEGQGDGTVEALSLEGLIAALEAEVASEKDARLRALAELQNFRRRSQQERAQQLQYANERLLEDLLPVVDTFEMATEAAETNEQTRIVCKGYEMILEQLREVVARYGVTEIEVAEGEMFDPERHDAIDAIPTAKACEGTVMRMLRKGYVLHERVLRPAQVAVAVRPGGEGAE